MGKRSTTSTKSGKFMNPTDQARKEARRRELKKNKKQRQAVRQAVLKGKNPREIVAELEKLDDMEFNVLVPPPLNDKVLRDKRRKLHETWQRVIRMYEKEDVEQYVELKKLWHNYQNRKHEVVQHFESVQNAQRVTVDEIPLPSLPDGVDPNAAAGGHVPDSIPLPPSVLMQPKGGILKKPSVLESLKPKTCPGVPAGPPPALSEYDDEKEDDEEGREEGRRGKKIRFDDEDSGGQSFKAPGEEDVVAPGEETGPQVDEIQKKMLLMAGQDVNQYMKQMEEVHKQTQAEKAEELQNRLARLERSERQQQPGPHGIEGGPPGPPPGAPPVRPHLLGAGNAPAHLLAGPSPLGGLPRPPRPPVMYRPAPPPLRPGMAPPTVRLPPGPPPGRPPAPPPGLPPGRPPMAGASGGGGGGVRMPPGPPPGLPGMHQGGIVSAAPQLNKESKLSTSSSGVIEAKPQMRNLKSDITRFVPTNVKIKREGSAKKKQADPLADIFRNPHAVSHHQHAQHIQQQHQRQQGSKDDAYAQFMAEIDQFMKD